jgi:hypothetical protein
MSLSADLARKIAAGLSRSDFRPAGKPDDMARRPGWWSVTVPAATRGILLLWWVAKRL